MALVNSFVGHTSIGRGGEDQRDRGNCASGSDFSSTRGRRGQPVTTLVVPSSVGTREEGSRERGADRFDEFGSYSADKTDELIGR